MAIKSRRLEEPGVSVRLKATPVREVRHSPNVSFKNMLDTMNRGSDTVFSSSFEAGQFIRKKGYTDYYHPKHEMQRKFLDMLARL